MAGDADGWATYKTRDGTVWYRTTCEVCGEPIAQPPTGRPRRFCSTRCRVAAHRQTRNETVGDADD